LPTELALADISQLPDGRVIAVGEQGVVLERGADARWRVTRTGGPDLTSLAVTPDGRAYAVGDNGLLLQLTPTPRVLTASGPNLRELRTDSDGRRFFARPDEQRSTLSVVFQLGMGVVVALLALLILRITWQRVSRLLKASAMSSALGPIHAAVETPSEGVLRYRLKATTRTSLDAGAGHVRLLLYDVGDAHRELAHAVGQDHAVAATGAGQELIIEGELEARMDTVPDAPQVVLELVLTAGRGRDTYRVTV